MFHDPVAVTRNIQRVTEHIRSQLETAGVDDIDRRVLTLVPTREDGQVIWQDPAGEYWRTYHFIEQASIYDVVESPREAFEGARAFGEFQRQLVDLPPPRLTETIPDFHFTPRRFTALQQAINADSHNRAGRAREEIAFALAREPIVSVLTDLHRGGEIPERTTHNDTKFNNVLLDDNTLEGLCILDLDTVMPGLALYDFGDLVRTSTSATAEDEQDLDQVQMRLEMFEALARGYLAALGPDLNQVEKDHLAFAGRLITFEVGIRFLTDFLEGDQYFRTHRPQHNLDRCRTQFRLLESMEQQQDQMQRVVAGIR